MYVTIFSIRLALACAKWTKNQFVIFNLNTPSLNGKSIDLAWIKTYYIPFLQAFHIAFNHVIFKMIPWPKLEGSHS